MVDREVNGPGRTTCVMSRIPWRARVVCAGGTRTTSGDRDDRHHRSDPRRAVHGAGDHRCCGSHLGGDRRGRRPAGALPRGWPPPARRPRPSSPTRTGTAERYVRSGCVGQAAGGYVDYDAGTGTGTCCDRGEVLAVSPTRPASSAARRVPDTAGREPASVDPSTRSRPRSGPAPGSAGASTTTRSSPAPSGSSAPATWPTCSSMLFWLPALDGVTDKLTAGRPGGRRRLRARHLVPADRRSLPGQHGGRFRQPLAKSSRSCWASKAAADLSDRVRFEVAPGRRLRRHRLRPGRQLRQPARHG